MAPRPNTDAALMMGLAHTLMTEGLHDVNFLNRCCVGWKVFEKYLTGQSDGIVRDAEWAAAISEVPAELYVSLSANYLSDEFTPFNFNGSVDSAETYRQSPHDVKHEENGTPHVCLESVQ